MYYIIYDQQYPMTAYMTYDDIIGMAEDVTGKPINEVSFAPLPCIAQKPQNKKECLMAAQQVLEQEWGLFHYFPYEEASEFIWKASENGIEEQALNLVATHDPKFAKEEYGVEL